MPRNGTGTYSLPQAAFVPGTTILSSAVNSDMSDIASALTSSLCTDGQSTMTGTLKALAGSASSPGYAFAGATNSGFFSAGSGNVGATVNGVLAATLTPTGWSGGTTATVPIGAISDFAGGTAPSLWYFCFGQAVSRTTYAALFNIIGTTYGVGDGSTTFNLPDCRGRIGVGKDDMGGTAANRITAAGSGITGTSLGANGGQETHALVTGELAAHSHTATSTVTDPGHAHNLLANASGSGSVTFSASGTFVAGGSINNGATASATTGITVATTNANTGSGTAHQNTQPTIIFNKIIFAGA